MKKLVLSLLGAATLATASNAMAMPTNDTYGVFISTGIALGAGTFAGVAFFDFDSEFFNVGGAVTPGGPAFPGSCVYSLQWLNESLNNFPAAPLEPLALSSQAWVQEQMSHGYGSCMENSITVVPSIVTMAPITAYGPSTGFDQFGQIDTIAALQLGEVGFPKPMLSGVVQFASALGPLSIFSITFQG